MTVDGLLAGTKSVTVLAAELADTLAEADRLPGALTAAMLDAGLTRMCLARELGGLGVPLATSVAVIEELAAVDGSLAWCTAVANAAASLLAGVPQEQARIVAADPQRLWIAGGFAPIGRATPDGPDLRLEGRWSFASGCTAASWMLGGAMLETGDPVHPLRPIVTFFPADQARIVDDWDVVGLRASGSHSVVATGVTLPATRTTTLFGAQRWSDDPIAAIGFFGLGSILAAVPLGIARRAMAELADLAAARTLFGQSGPLNENPTFQLEYATVLGRLRAARSYVMEQTHELWQHAVAGSVPPLAEAGVGLALGAATDAATDAVQFAQRAAGTSAIRGHNVFARSVLDTMVVTRHVAFGQAQRTGAGRAVLGVPV